MTTAVEVSADGFFRLNKEKPNNKKCSLINRHFIRTASNRVL